MKKFLAISLIMFSLSNAGDLSSRAASVDDNDIAAEEIFDEVINKTARVTCDIVLSQIETPISHKKEKAMRFMSIFTAEGMPEIKRHKDEYIKLICEQLNPEERREVLSMMRHPLQPKLQQLGECMSELIQRTLSPEFVKKITLVMMMDDELMNGDLEEFRN